MRRTWVLFGAGLMLGGAALYFVRSGQDPASPPTVTDRSATSRTPESRGDRAPRAMEVLEIVTGSIDAAERATLHRLAAEADAAALESLLAHVAALPALASRAIALEVLLTRYAELNAPAAAALARELELDAAAVAPIFVAWAEREPRGALDALTDFDAATATTLGVALLESLGNDELGIARVLGAAPQIDAARLRGEAAAAKAAIDPEGAVEDALRLPPARRTVALARIAAVWVKNDVHGAIAHVEHIAEERGRNELKIAVLREWAASDPEALLAYVRDLDESEHNDAIPGAVQAVAVLDPERALRAAESLSGAMAALLRRSALRELARDDPLAAVRRAEILPLGGERDEILSAVAQSYGQFDPAAAIAWAQAAGSSSQLANVLKGVARVDPERAIELAFTLPDPTEHQRLLQSLVIDNRLDGTQTAALADRLLATPNRAAPLSMMARLWAQRAPQDALPWLLANQGRVPGGAIAQAGIELARRDAAAAIGYFDRIPSELRPAWLGAVAEGYARNDSHAAAAWVARYRGEAGYEAAAVAVAGRMATQDPVGAASLFDSIDASQARDSAASVRAIATSWARQDPTAAASWARALRDDDAAAGAMAAVAAQWVASDVLAARHWTLSVPASAARDAALVQVVGATAGTALAEPALLEAFSSGPAQQRGIGEAVRIVAQRDPAAARRLAAEFLTDRSARQAAERFIE